MSAVKQALRQAGIHQKLIAAVETRALRTGRHKTGEFPSNRHNRWTQKPADPQFGTETDCRATFLKLWGMLFCFTTAPAITDPPKIQLDHYTGAPIQPVTDQAPQS